LKEALHQIKVAVQEKDKAYEEMVIEQEVKCKVAVIQRDNMYNAIKKKCYDQWVEGRAFCRQQGMRRWMHTQHEKSCFVFCTIVFVVTIIAVLICRSDSAKAAR
jgi:DNA recombination-dependent growth factor C